MLHNNPRLLFVDQSAALAGGELNLYDFLRSSPPSASVVLLEDGPFRSLLERAGVPVCVLPLGVIQQIRRESGLSSLLQAIPAGLALCRSLRALMKHVDIVYANSQKAFLLAALSKRSGQPLIWHLHDILGAAHFSKVIRKIAVLSGNCFATRIIVNSKATAAAFVAEGGRADKLRLVYCGIDPLLFDRVSEATVASTRAAICPTNRLLVGVFGRLAHWKGQHVLLEAISALPTVEVAVVGAPLFGEDAYQEQLFTMARELNVANRVHFLGFRTDIPELMKSVDVIAHTSVAPEPFGRVIVEGMLARKPVIASNAGGAAEIIEHNRSGLLVLPNSSGDLREAIDRLSREPQLMDDLAAGARERAEKIFCLSEMVAGVESVIAEVASGLPDSLDQTTR